MTIKKLPRGNESRNPVILVAINFFLRFYVLKFPQYSLSIIDRGEIVNADCQFEKVLFT